MKYIIVVGLILFIGSFSVDAQNLNSIQRGQRGYSPPARNFQAGEPQKPDVNQMSLERADFYMGIIDIDVFEKEVLRTYLKDYYTAKVDIEFDPELKFDDKRELINAEQKKFEKSLKEVFSQDQVEQILIEEQFGTKGKEKKKKDKKKKRKNKKG